MHIYGSANKIKQFLSHLVRFNQVYVFVMGLDRHPGYITLFVPSGSYNNSTDLRTADYFLFTNVHQKTPSNKTDAKGSIFHCRPILV